MAVLGPRALSGLSQQGMKSFSRGISSSAPVLMGTKHLDWYFNSLRRQEELKQTVAPPPYPSETLHGRKRQRVFFDVQFGKDSASSGADGAGEALPTQRIVFELADDIVPTTCLNFVNVSA